MTQLSGDGWISDKGKSAQSDGSVSSKDFHTKQQGKTMKAAIGIAILVFGALVLARMHPVPHQIPSGPSSTTTETNRTSGPTTDQLPAQTPAR